MKYSLKSTLITLAKLILQVTTFNWLYPSKKEFLVAANDQKSMLNKTKLE